MNKSETYWDQQSHQYDVTESSYEQTSIKIVEKTKRHLKASDVVLDYACGTGSITIEIADKVKELHAIDISSGMIDVAARKAGERKIENIHFAQSTLFDGRYVRESFDVILAFNILHLLDDIPHIMQRINELLKPGGLFISVTGCMGAKRSLPGVLLPLLSKIGIVPYVKIYKFPELKDAITKGDFQIVEAEVLSYTLTLPNYFVVAKKPQKT